MYLFLWVLERPRPKGSLVGRCLRNSTHTVVMREQAKDSERFRKAVSGAARDALRVVPDQRSDLYAGPVAVRLDFYLPRQQAVRNGEPTGEAVPSHMTPYPTAKSLADVDKLARNVLDALTGTVLVDDSQVVDLHVRKFWGSPDGDEPEGVWIHVSEAP